MWWYYTGESLIAPKNIPTSNRLVDKHLSIRSMIGMRCGWPLYSLLWRWSKMIVHCAKVGTAFCYIHARTPPSPSHTHTHTHTYARTHGHTTFTYIITITYIKNRILMFSILIQYWVSNPFILNKLYLYE